VEIKARSVWWGAKKLALSETVKRCFFHFPAAFWHRPRHGITKNGPVLLAERANWQQFMAAWPGAGSIPSVHRGAEVEVIMPFSVPLAAAIFLTIWFTVLFAVLPFGVRSQHESGDVVPGTDPGAPVAPRLLAKAIWTTLISAVVFAGLAAFAAYTR
jgi:predicted secreted protein